MRRWLLVVGVLLLLLSPSAYMAWSHREMPQLGQMHDDSIYFVNAKSLAEGSGYRIVSLPEQPYQTKYPPLYPLLLSMVWKVSPEFPQNLPLATLFAWLMLPGYILLARHWFHQLDFRGLVGWLLCAAVALNSYVVYFGMNLMTELLFSALLMASLALAERGRRAGDGVWWAAVAGAVAAAAYLTKTAAAPLAVSVPLCYALRKQWRHAAVFLAAMLPAVVCWSLWMGTHLSGSSDLVTLYYTNYLGYQLHNIALRDLPALVWLNFDCLLSGIGGLILVSLSDSFLGKLFTQLLGIAAIWGTVRMARGIGVTQYHLFAAGYVALLLVWHYPPNERFVLPLFPLLLAGFATELRHVLRGLRRLYRTPGLAHRAATCVFALLLIGLGAKYLYATANGICRMLPDTLERDRVQLAEKRQVYEWISRNVSPEASFLAYHDPLLYLYTGRRACSLPYMPRTFYRNDGAGMIEPFRTMPDFARRHGLSYFLLTSVDFVSDLPAEVRPAAWNVMLGNSDFHNVYKWQTASVYSIRPE